jgi:hypothetical protein
MDLGGIIGWEGAGMFGCWVLDMGKSIRFQVELYFLKELKLKHD